MGASAYLRVLPSIKIIILAMILLAVSACGSEADAVTAYEYEPHEDIDTTHEYEPYENIETIYEDEPYEDTYNKDNTPVDKSIADIPLPYGYYRNGGLIMRTVAYDTGLVFVAEGVDVNVASPPRYARLGSTWMNTEYGSFLMPVWEHYNFTNENLPVGFYCTITGVERIPAVFEAAADFSNGLARVRYGGLYGFINTDGEWVIPPMHEQQRIDSSFQEGLVRVQSHETDLWGFIDTNGHQAIPFIYNAVSSFNASGTASVQQGSQNFLINRYGEKLVELSVPYMSHSRTRYFGDGLLLIFGQGAIRGVFDLSGAEIIPVAYNAVERICDTRFLVQTGGLFTRDGTFAPHLIEHEIVDVATGEKISIVYNHELDMPMTHGNQVFRDGVAVLRSGRDGDWGLIDTNGEFVIPFGRYTGIRNFGDGLIGVRVGDGPWWCRDARWGFADSTGREIVPPIYLNVFTATISNNWLERKIQPFDLGVTGVAHVQCADTFLWGIVDNTGREMFAPEFESIRYFRGDFTIANTGGTEFLNGMGGGILVGGTWHVINRSGEVVASFEYAILSQLTENLFLFADSVTEAIMDHGDLAAFMYEIHAVWPGSFGVISIYQPINPS